MNVTVDVTGLTTAIMSSESRWRCISSQTLARNSSQILPAFLAQCTCSLTVHTMIIQSPMESATCVITAHAANQYPLIRDLLPMESRM